MGRRISHQVLSEIGSLLLVGMIVLVLWECAAKLGLYDAVFLPPPSRLYVALRSMTASGELANDVTLSLGRAMLGFIGGSALGIAMGLLTGRLRTFDYTLGQLIRLVRPIPSIALVPLAIVWLGLGETPKYLLVLWGVFFPVWINAHVGASQVDREIIWAARSLGAGKTSLFWQIILPASFPFVIAGMRAGVAVAFIVLVAAEMAGAFGGLGYRIYASHLVFRVDKMLVGIASLGLLGALVDILFAAVLRAIPWNREYTRGRA